MRSRDITLTLALTCLATTAYGHETPYGAAATAPLPPAAECLYVDAYGADPSGRNDSAIAFQTAVDKSAQLRKTACVREGTYKLGRPIRMKNNSALAMERDALLIRAFHGGSGEMSGLFTSVSFNSKTNNVRISGGTITATYQGRGYSGRVFSWYGDNWTIDNVYINDWGHIAGTTLDAGGRAISYVGDNGTITNNTVRGPGCGWGCAGIMVAGGTGALVANNDVVSGDDAYCNFPSAVPDSPVFNTPIRDVLFLHNKGVSTHARLYGGGLHLRTDAAPDDPKLSTTIENIVIRDMVGEVATSEPTSAALVILNRTPEGTVRNITFEDVHVAAVQPVDIGFRVQGEFTGEVQNVTISNSSFGGTCTNAALSLLNAPNPTIEGSRFEASADCRYAGWAGGSTRDVTSTDTVYIGRRYGF